jgi:uncharacterized membrane protein
VEDSIARATLFIATLTDACATLIIGLATLEAAIRSAIAFAHFRQTHQGITLIRWRFGRWLSLALDFLIASDILRTGVSPSWSEIGQLAAIVAIRILITFTLGKETAEIQPEVVQAPTRS